MANPSAAAARFDVVVVGSLNLDVVVRTRRHPAPGETVAGSDYLEVAGGKGLNQAVAAARAGARVAKVGAVGDDAAGELLRSILHDDGIDDALVATVPGVPSGRAAITVDASGENSIVVVPGANGHVGVDALPSASVVLAQLEVPQSAIADAFARARDAGARTMLDPSPAVPLGAHLVDLCDVIIPNEHEAAVLGGADMLGAHGADVIVTTGAAGARHPRGHRSSEMTAGLATSDSAVRGDSTPRRDAASRSDSTVGGTAAGRSASSDRSAAAATGDSITERPSFDVDVVDTTGAGDAFRGAYAARRALGATVSEALAVALAAGALATTRVGAVPSQPHLAEIERLLATR